MTLSVYRSATSTSCIILKFALKSREFWFGHVVIQGIERQVGSGAYCTYLCERWLELTMFG
jgi:hypothetical protein